MGLKSIARKAAKTVLQIVDDLSEPVVYHSFGTLDYDAATGVSTETDGSEYALSVVFANFKEKDIDNEVVRSEDKKALIADLSLSFAPKVGDSLVHGSDTWYIVSIKLDPASALWIFQIRLRNDV